VQVVAVFIGVYYLTNGEGITVVWPGQSPEKDLLNGPKYNVQINLLAGERYFFDVKVHQFHDVNILT
jgi:hypothetical protein